MLQILRKATTKSVILDCEISETISVKFYRDWIRWIMMTAFGSDFSVLSVSPKSCEWKNVPLCKLGTTDKQTFWILLRLPVAKYAYSWQNVFMPPSIIRVTQMPCPLTGLDFHLELQTLHFFSLSKQVAMVAQLWKKERLKRWNNYKRVHQEHIIYGPLVAFCSVLRACFVKPSLYIYPFPLSICLLNVCT